MPPVGVNAGIIGCNEIRGGPVPDQLHLEVVDQVHRLAEYLHTELRGLFGVRDVLPRRISVESGIRHAHHELDVSLHLCFGTNILKKTKVPKNLYVTLIEPEVPASQFVQERSIESFGCLEGLLERFVLAIEIIRRALALDGCS